MDIGLFMRWSRLQQLIYEIWVPELELQIHCTSFRNPEGPAVGRYWVTLDKETIWEAPPAWRDDLANNEISESASNVTAIFREYLDTPREAIFRKQIAGDKWGVVELMNAADRRMGKAKLQELGETSIYPAVAVILAKRRKR